MDAETVRAASSIFGKAENWLTAPSNEESILLPRHGKYPRMPVSSSRRQLALPLGLQLLGLIGGALIVAQLVTLALTILIPPASVQRWDLDAVATSLLGQADDDTLDRRRMAGPPDISQPGWLVSETSREALAKRVNRPTRDVVLAFYTQLPVGGTAVPVNQPSARLSATSGEAQAGSLAIWESFVGAAHAQAGPGGPPPGGMPGGGFPGGGFPGGGPLGGGPPLGGGAPGGLPGGGTAGGNAPGTGPQGTPPDSTSAQVSGGGAPPAAGQPAISGSPPPATVTQPGAGLSPAAPPASQLASPPLGGSSLRMPQAVPQPRPTARMPTPVVPALTRPAAAPDAGIAVPSISPAVTGRGAAGPTPSSETPQPIPFRETKSILSFTTPPFIEGDFIAAIRQADGSWIAVAPKAEPFPNRWQKRVMLWFALSLLIVTPLVWLFARRIVKPLEGFAHAAETLGRDPSATVMPLSGPAEIGRAARAFNQMRNRLRAFVDDRTAMVGAISHDLRTPLTRLRFRLEDVPDDQRGDLLAEVDEMELMISQVIAFIRDASTPGPRERVDLTALVESTVNNARLTGNDIQLEASGQIPVEVDPIGIRRLFANLLENAVKYGGHPRVRVAVQGDVAVAEVIDDGPGIPEDERERAFEPFFRCEEARESEKPGSGLGLAVCRSIARAHGGDVQLEQREEGFVASLVLPSLYVDGLRKAA
ncbi:MAG: ATP-binding protein [Novosphingobium sp.]